MRKLKLQVQMSIDGFIAGPNGEMDWLTWNWDEKLKEYVLKLNDPIDTILLGRKMTDGFITAWRERAEKPEDVFYYKLARKMLDTPKVVFSKTLQKSKWPNAEVANGDITTEVNQLKSRNGKDIIVYGGAKFDSSLIKAGLVDEYHLFVNPTMIGNGLTIFKDLSDKRNLSLIKATPFDCGIVVLHYEPKKAVRK